jgi:hypothetical protein
VPHKIPPSALYLWLAPAALTLMQRKLTVKNPTGTKAPPEFWCEALADAVGLDRLLIGRVSLPSRTAF